MDEQLVETLPEPWCSKGRGIFAGLRCDGSFLRWDDCLICAGEVDSALAESVKMGLYPFAHGQGFIFDECLTHYTLVVPGLADRGISLARNSRVICAGKATIFQKDMMVKFETHPIVVPFPELVPDLAWEAVHLFAGAFHGWSQALRWISKQNQPFELAREVSIDWDEDVMKIWSVKHGRTPKLPPFEPVTSCILEPQIGLCADVKDLQKLHWCGAKCNLIMTLSPPCVSWSRGGLQKGLASIEGWAFVDAIRDVAILQPPLVTAECADELYSHDHAAILRSLFSAIGYRKIWEQVVESHRLTGAHRTRWLCVWVRASVSSQGFPDSFRLSDAPRLSWADPAYSFRLPAVLSHQLKLSHSELSQYGDFMLLPAAKKQKLMPTSSAQDVLRARLVAVDEYWPTLCANYSQQHLLDARHVAAKGLFAALVDFGEGFQFIDPCRCACLLGAVETVVFPVKLQLAFRQLGNAISIPQAVLALSIGLTAVGEIDVNLLHFVKKAWEDRLLPTTTIVTVRNHLVWIQLAMDFSVSLRLERVAVSDTSSQCTITLNNGDSPAVFGVSDGWTLIRLLMTALDLPYETLSQFKVTSQATSFQADMRTPCKTLASCADRWTLLVGQSPAGVIVFANDLVSPTLPFDIDGLPKSPKLFVPDFLRLSLIDFDLLLGTQTYLRLLKVIERCNSGPLGDATRKHFVHLALPDIATVAKLHIPLDADVEFFENLRNTLYPGLDVAVCPLAVPVSTMPGVDVHLLASKVHPRGFVPIIFEAEKFGICTQWTPPVVKPTVRVFFQGELFRTCAHNASSIRPSCHLLLKPGDVVTLRRSCDNPDAIRAGGHHTHQQPPVLPPNATFMTRCEFSTNTNGWLASDELEFAIRNLQWMKPFFAAFCGPAVWNTATNQLVQGNLYEISFRNKPRCLLPVLIDAHWAAFEVCRSVDRVEVRLHGVPALHRTQAKSHVAKLLDLPLYKINFVVVNPPTIEHMCGWQLLFQWYVASDLVRDMPDGVGPFLALPPECQRVVDEVLHDSVLEWTRAGAPVALIQFAIAIRRAFLVGLACDHDVNALVTTSRLVSHASALPATVPVHLPRPSSAPAFDPLARRMRFFDVNPGWLASDELDYLLDCVRVTTPGTYFPPPAKWCPVSGRLLSCGDFGVIPALDRPVCWLVLVGAHWIRLDLVPDPSGVVLWHSHFDSASEIIQGIRTACATAFRLDAEAIRLLLVESASVPNMCGWQLLFGLFLACGTWLATPPQTLFGLIATHPQAERIRQSVFLASQTWTNSTADQQLSLFAHHGRLAYICRLLEGRIPTAFSAGGAKEKAQSEDIDSKMSDASAPSAVAASPAGKATQKKIDPLWEHDPWAKRSRPTQTRWEDLQLPVDHPFVDASGKPLPQQHRLQATQIRHGLVMITKTSLTEFIKLGTTQTFAVLLPTADLSAFGDVALKVQGPFETVVHDPNLKKSYKRLTQLLVLHGHVKYQLATPSCTFTADEHIEIVLELDSRTILAKDFDGAAEHPVATFRKLANGFCADKSEATSFYGFRNSRHPAASKDDKQLQCIVQLPKCMREAALKYSGQFGLLTRDFLAKGATSSDTSILPRFWETSAKNLHDAVIIASQAKGVCGVVITRRGIAIRCWTAFIEDARRSVLAGDARITEENIKVVPKVVVEATGWPAATEPKHIVKSVLQATGLAPLPMRAFRVAGVHGWSLAFESRPTVDKFTVQFNDKQYEVLLADSQPGLFNRLPKQQKPQKNIPRSSNFEPLPAPVSYPSAQKSAEAERIDRLEERIDKIDTRQSRLETKFDGRFDEVSAMLRQLVGQQTSRDRSPTNTLGESPPYKQPRNA